MLARGMLESDVAVRPVSGRSRITGFAIAIAGSEHGGRRLSPRMCNPVVTRARRGFGTAEIGPRGTAAHWRQNARRSKVRRSGNAQPRAAPPCR